MIFGQGEVHRRQQRHLILFGNFTILHSHKENGFNRASHIQRA